MRNLDLFAEVAFDEASSAAPPPTPDTTAHNTSAANAAATFTISAPGADQAIRLNTLYFGYSASPTNGLLTIAATGLATISIPVTSAGAAFLPIDLLAPDNTAVTVTLSAGGADVVGRCSATFSTEAV
jgi:hypothetical protein